MTCLSDQRFEKELQIDFSDAHSASVNSDGPVGGRSSRLMRACEPQVVDTDALQPTNRVHAQPSSGM